MSILQISLTEPMSFTGGRRNRIELAYLLLTRGHNVPRRQLAHIIWGPSLPLTWETSLRESLSRARVVIGSDIAAIVNENESYRLEARQQLTTDVEQALDGAPRAERAFDRDKDPAAALDIAEAVAAIAQRPFFPTENGDWFQAQREALYDAHHRALNVVAAVHAANDDELQSAGAAYRAAQIRFERAQRIFGPQTPGTLAHLNAVENLGAMDPVGPDLTTPRWQRRLAVATLEAEGKPCVEIAKRLQISVATVYRDVDALRANGWPAPRDTPAESIIDR